MTGLPRGVVFLYLPTLYLPTLLLTIRGNILQNTDTGYLPPLCTLKLAFPHIPHDVLLVLHTPCSAPADALTLHST